MAFTVLWRGGAAVTEVEVHSDAPPQRPRSGAHLLSFLLGVSI
jgi:hypothetical protein